MSVEETNFEEVFARVKTLGIRTQQGIADAVGVKQSSVADAKKRGAFPLRWIEIIGKTYNMSLDYLLTGSSPVLTPDSQKDIAEATGAKTGDQGQASGKGENQTKIEIDKVAGQGQNTATQKTSDGEKPMSDSQKDMLIVAQARIIVDQDAKIAELEAIIKGKRKAQG